MNTRFKVFASYNILQYLCDFIHVLIFVTVSKCRKSPKLTNIVIYHKTERVHTCEQSMFDDPMLDITVCLTIDPAFHGSIREFGFS